MRGVFRSLFGLLILIKFTMLSSCTAQVPSSQIEKWKSQVASQNVLGLDVRTSLETKVNPAPGSKNFSFQNLEPFIKSGDKEQLVYVFCESGGRAGKAKTTLEKAGFKNVVNIGDWRTWNKLNQK